MPSQFFSLSFTDVEELLGKPVQEELSAETGLDVALDALLDVANGNYDNVFFFPRSQSTWVLNTRTMILSLVENKGCLEDGGKKKIGIIKLGKVVKR